MLPKPVSAFVKLAFGILVIAAFGTAFFATLYCTEKPSEPPAPIPTVIPALPTATAIKPPAFSTWDTTYSGPSHVISEAFTCGEQTYKMVGTDVYINEQIINPAMFAIDGDLDGWINTSLGLIGRQLPSGEYLAPESCAP